MFRIVNGFAYRGKVSDSRSIIKIQDLGNGHREVTVTRCIDWTEDGPVDPDWQPKEPTKAELAEKAEATRQRAAKRARTRVRQLVKAQALDTMLTLTYRDNVTDLAVCKRHLDLFLKRLRKVWASLELGSFPYVAVFEQQKRGAWHVHIATRQLPRELPARGGVLVKSWNVIRAVWRAVVGEHGGNIDVSRRKGRDAFARAAKLAAYLSKYLAKAFEEDGPEKARRFQAGQADIPPPVRLQFDGAFADVLELAIGAVTDVGPLGSAWLSRWKDVAFFASEPLRR